MGGPRGAARDGPEARRPGDRRTDPSADGEGGRRRPAEFAGRGPRESPLPARDAARPTAPWDVEPARRLLDLRRTLRPAVSRARAHRWRCPSVCPAACVSVCPVEGGGRWEPSAPPAPRLIPRVSAARRAFRAVQRLPGSWRALSLRPSVRREREGLGSGRKGGDRWVEEALTSCPGRDLSLPPPTPSCQPVLRSFKAGDSWQRVGGGSPFHFPSCNLFANGPLICRKTSHLSCFERRLWAR